MAATFSTRTLARADKLTLLWWAALGAVEVVLLLAAGSIVHWSFVGPVAMFLVTAIVAEITARTGRMAFWRGASIMSGCFGLIVTFIVGAMILDPLAANSRDIPLVDILVPALLIWPVVAIAAGCLCRAFHRLIDHPVEVDTKRAETRCLHCGYSRIGQASERCPECGQAWEHERANHPDAGGSS